MMQAGPSGQREREILTAVVETYISTGEPVGSRTLARSSKEALSPATIRNVMADLSDAFIALPGGYGTLEEFCEILTWTQLGLHAKPSGLLNVEGFYDPFLSLIDHAITEGFIRIEHRSLILVGTEPESLIDQLLHFKPPSAPKWIGSRDT